MAIFPTDYVEKTTIAADDMILFSDSEDGGKLKKAKYSNLKGPAGANGTSFIREGAYSAGTTYQVNDAVSYNGSSYICILESTGNLPTNATYWSLMAAKGTDGAGSGDMSKATYDPANYNSQLEAVSNKKTSLAENSDTYYPTQKAVKTAVDAKQDTLSKASGSDVDTGTDDAKYVTSKAIEDSSYMKNPMTTAGDIIYGGTSGVPTRLAKGTAGQVLKMNSGATAPEWAAAGGGGITEIFHATLSTNYSLTVSSAKVPFDTTSINQNSNFNTTNNRFIAPSNGIYQFNVVLYAFSLTSGDSVQLAIKKGGSTSVFSCLDSSLGSGMLSASVIISLNKDEYVEVFSYNANAARGTLASGIGSFFSGYKLA